MSLRTLCDIPRRLRDGVHKTDQLLYKERGAWHGIATGELCDTIRDQALGLRALGIEPGDRVAVLSENRPEWTATDYAILSAGAVTVPIYPTLLPDQIAFILRDSGARALFVSTATQLDKVRAVRPALAALEEVAIFDAPGALPPGVRPWDAVAAIGAAARAADPAVERALDAAAPDDLASIIYTSGTTGQPKGVMLTHGNFAHNVAACCAAIPFQASDLCLSVLPLSHIYERMVEYCYLHRGATIAYAESVEALAANIQEVRPTIVCCVPRLFEKMHRRILDNGLALPAARRAVFRWALAVARACGARAGRPGGPGAILALQRRLADRLVYRTVRERTGGRLRFFVSGSAPLQRAIAEDLNGMGIVIFEGYGLTECSPVIALNTPASLCIGSVGRPIDGLEVRLAEDGEIQVRGPSVMRGYYKNDEATRESIVDGWLLTGDIGRFDGHGCLVVTDRKKEVLKTSGGKMIAPQPIESMLRADRFIGQAVVIGERRRFLSALIVPNFDQIRSYAVIKGIAETEIAALIRHPRVVDLFERRIAAINERLARYERIRRFRLLDREFALEAGEITPTLKPRRRVIEERHRALIEEMYVEGPAAAAF
jgi:long-chain acyl-CoA synthetase